MPLNACRTMLLAALALAALASAPSRAAADEGVLAMDVMRRSTIGAYSGRFLNCANKASSATLALQLHEVPGQDENLHLEGTLKTADAGGGGPQIDAEVRGTVLADSGYLTLSPKPPAPRPDPSTSTIGGVTFKNPFANVTAAVKQTLHIKDAAPTPPLAFEGGFIRDFDGKGFVGVVDSEQFKCHAFVLQRTDGTRSDRLPLPSAEFAFRQAGLENPFLREDAPFDGTQTGFVPSHHKSWGAFSDDAWLLYAGQLGDTKSIAYLGRIYEYGFGVQIDYAKALAYYQQAAARNDAMAQLGLAHLYSHGFGVERDMARARQYAAQYGAVRIAALKVCTDATVLARVNEMIIAGSKAPPSTIGGMLASVAMMNTRIDAGDVFLYQAVSAADLDSMTAPFLCKYTVKAINAKVTDMTPFRSWRTVDANGREFYEDNADEIVSNQQRAGLMEAIIKNASVQEVMQVEARGGSRFTVSRLQENMVGLMVPAASAEVEVGARR